MCSAWLKAPVRSGAVMLVCIMMLLAGGCPTTELDGDGDGIADHIDPCPADPLDECGASAADDECVLFDLVEGRSYQPSVIKLYFQLSYCDGQPAVGIMPEQFIISEDGHEVSAFESHQAFAQEPESTALATVLLLDMSGSIIRSGNLPDLQRAAKTFVSQVAENQPVAVWAFDGGRGLRDIVPDATRNVAALLQAIEDLSDYELVDESTNLNGAIINGLSAVDAALNMGERKTLNVGSLVVFTDGTDQAGRVGDQYARQAVDASLHRVYTIGLGGEIDAVHLEQIGKDGPYVADEVESLDGVFRQVAADIDEIANSYYVLAYCSPKRAGVHDLELALASATGSLTYEFDASPVLRWLLQQVTRSLIRRLA